MNNITDFPAEAKRDLIKEMTGPDRLGTDVILQGRLVPHMTMHDRRPGRDEIEFCIGRAMFGFPAKYARDAAEFAFAAMAVGTGCDALNFEPAPLAMTVVNLGEIG